MRRSGALLLLALAGCGAGAHATPTAVHHGDGLTYRVPSGWHVAPRSLTPHLVNPRELFTAGTGQLVARPARCAQMPSAALAAMGENDVLVTVQERFGSDSGFPPRPRRFGLDGPSISEAAACAGPHPAFTSYWFGFRDRGRGFHVLVAVGRSAPDTRVQQALGILDSMRFAARQPVRLNPNDAIAEHDAAAGIDFVHPSAWRWYRGALTQAIAARDQIALGTFRLRQRAPDTNCTPATAVRARPPGGGLIVMYESTLNPTELARIPPRPGRLLLSGPRPYECFGSSWRVDFRDGGRAFSAHVYGPLRRRREALAILDSLRIRPAPFASGLHAARFRGTAAFRTRVSGPQQEGGCLRQRTSWAATVPFTDGPNELPPHRVSLQRRPLAVLRPPASDVRATRRSTSRACGCALAGGALGARPPWRDHGSRPAPAANL